MRVEIVHRVAVFDSDGARIPLRPRTAKVLAVLMLRRPASVSSDELISALWTEPPPSAEKGVQNAVVELRQLFGSGAVERTNAGYVLRLDRSVTVDLDDLEELIGRRELPAVRRALGLLEGELLFDLDGSDLGAAQAARLEFLRADLEETNIDLLIEQGDYIEAARSAIDAVAAAPVREHRWAQLALALYSCGRQAESLQSLVEARRVLRVECGIVPGPALIALERRILAQDPTLLVQRTGAEGDERVVAVALDSAREASDRLDPDWLEKMLETMRLARATGQGAVLRSAAALVGIADTGLGRTWRDRRRSAAIEEVLGGQSDDDGPNERLLRARLMTNQALSSIDVDARHLEWQQSKALSALQLLDSINEPERLNLLAVTDVLQGCHSALLGTMHRDSRRECVSRLVALARRHEEPRVIMAAGCVSVVEYAQVGAFVEADQWLASLDDLREELPLLTWNREVIRASRLLTQGEFERAIVAADAARDAPGAGMHPVAGLIHGAQHLDVHNALGTTRLILPIFEPQLAELDHSLGDPSLAVNALRVGRTRAASDALAYAMRTGFSDLKADFLFMGNLRMWAEVALALRDKDAATTLVALIEPHAALFTGSRTASFGVSAESIIGRLAALLGSSAESLEWHRSAVISIRSARADHLLAEAQAWLAADVASWRHTEQLADDAPEVLFGVESAREAIEISRRSGAVMVMDLAQRSLDTLLDR